MKKAVVLILALCLMALPVLAISKDSVRGDGANAYIRYGAFQSQGVVKEDGTTLKWNSMLGSEVLQETNTLIKFVSVGYAQVGRDRTVTQITVTYKKNTGVLEASATGFGKISKQVR